MISILRWCVTTLPIVWLCAYYTVVRRYCWGSGTTVLPPILSDACYVRNESTSSEFRFLENPKYELFSPHFALNFFLFFNIVPVTTIIDGLLFYINILKSQNRHTRYCLQFIWNFHTQCIIKQKVNFLHKWIADEYVRGSKYPCTWLLGMFYKNNDNICIYVIGLFCKQLWQHNYCVCISKEYYKLFEYIHLVIQSQNKQNINTNIE